MSKEKITTTIDPRVVATTDADAAEEGLNRSEYVERVLRAEHYRRLLARVSLSTPADAGDEQRLRAVSAWQRGNATGDLAFPA